MSGVRDPERTALRRAAVQASIDGWSGPVAEAAAVAVDGESGLRVEVGRRVDLVGKLEEMVKHRELQGCASTVTTLRAMLAWIATNPDRVPVFVLGDSEMFLEPGSVR